MKKVIITTVLGTISFLPYAQTSVGVNTTNPQASLDVRGSQRVGGINNYMQYDSVTGRVQWIGSALYTPISQQIIKHSASSEGLYAGGGRLEYRNTTVPVFYSDWTNGNGYFKNNLGIDNLTPQFPLSFNGSLGDKISLWTDGTPTHYGFGIQPAQFQMFSKTVNDDIVFGFGSSTAFTERMRIKGTGFVGIGTNNPNAPLGFPPALGKKITLYPGATGDVGLAVQGNLLQIYSDNPNADIAFGYDQAGTLTERMRIKGNGNVGIGNNPSYWLDVNGRMRIRSGGNNSISSGIWFNNNSNVEAAFAGMEDDTHIGFFGNNGAGWKFAMNTQTGALQVNGNEGVEKQILASSGGSSSWKTIGSLVQTFYRYASGMQNPEGSVSDVTPNITLSAISQTITVNTKSRLIITASFCGNIVCVVCGGGGEAIVDMRVNGTEVVPGALGLTRLEVSPNAFDYVTIPNYFYDVNPGTYTIEFFTQSHTGAAFQLWSIYSTIIALPID
jgi:hypothetical protein